MQSSETVGSKQSSDTFNINTQWLVFQLKLGTEKENQNDKIVNTQSMKKCNFWGSFASWLFVKSFSWLKKW